MPRLPVRIKTRQTQVKNAPDAPKKPTDSTRRKGDKSGLQLCANVREFFAGLIISLDVSTDSKATISETLQKISEAGIKM